MDLGIIEGLREVFTNLQAGALLGVCTILYLVINLLRGKLVFNGKPVKVPWLTDKFNNLAKELKTIIILGLFGVIGIITGIADGATGFWEILDSLTVGLLLGGSTIGLRNGIKQGKSITKKIVDQIKANRKKKK
jgi:hypothetical protein